MSLLTRCSETQEALVKLSPNNNQFGESQILMILSFPISEYTSIFENIFFQVFH